MGEYLLGIDIGTSACKTALFRPDGTLAAAADSPYAVEYPAPGWAEQHPDTWWQAAVLSIRQVLAQSGVRAGEIAGIGVDGQSWSMIPLDAGGNVLMPSPIWTDTRAREACDEMIRGVGEEALFSCSGNPVMPSYTLPKVLWMKKRFPGLYARTEKVLQSNSFIVYRLTGAVTQDLSQGYGWHCFDMARGAWNAELAEALGVKSGLLPDIFPCSAIVGRVTEEAAAQTGLLAGTPVAAGGLDAACSTLGVGVIHPGQTQEQGGQAGGMSICMEKSAPNPALILSRHVVPGTWLLQGGTTGGGGALKWFREQFCPEMTFEEMSSAAAQVPPGSGGLIFLPYLAGERSPLWNPDARGVFYGLSFSSTRQQMIRAVMEGVAFSLKHNLDVAAKTGALVRVLRATGGSSRSPVWMQIKADVTGCRLEVPRAETAAAWGAAILAGIGTGLLPDWETAVRGIRVEKQYAPDAQNAAIYRNEYARYRHLIEDLAPMMRGNTAYEREQEQ